MRCPKCKGRVVRDHEFEVRGSMIVAACQSCGWRGDIIEDRRVPLQVGAVHVVTEEESEMARGICKGCEQERALVAAGLCWKCREKAIEDGSYTPRTGKAAAESAPEPAAEPAVPPPAEPVPVTEPAPPIPAEEPEQGLVPVAFDVRDAELLRRLEESATYNRRSLGAEILFRLDRSFDLNMS